MKTILKYILPILIFSLIVSCSKDENNAVANTIFLHFNNTFKQTPIVLGGANSVEATENTSINGQVHHFSELKYVISNIRLVNAEGEEIPYHINDLDRGAWVINQAKPETLDCMLEDIPVGTYNQIKFGLGIKPDLNILDEVRFPAFYAAAGANDTEMMWEWGTGYRFVKIEGFYDEDHKALSIHTGSTVTGTAGEPDTYTQGVNAYRDIILTLPDPLVVGNVAGLTIDADFDKLLSGLTHKIILGTENSSPSVHSADEMVKFVDNLGGDGSTDQSGMFSVGKLEN